MPNQCEVAAARVRRKRSVSKQDKIPLAVNRRELGRSIDSMPQLGDSVDLTTPTSGDDQRPPASADVREQGQPPASSARPSTPPRAASAPLGPAPITLPQPAAAPVDPIAAMQVEMLHMREQHVQEMARMTDLVQNKEMARDMYHKVQEPDGEQHALEELERREALMREGRMSSAEVLHPFLHRDDATGMHLGHITARLKLTSLGAAFHARHRQRWHDWMNMPTYSQKAPMNWLPLMCIMESTARPQARETTSRDIEVLLGHITDCTNYGTLCMKGGAGGTFLHMARKPEYVHTVMEAVNRSRRSAGELVKVLNKDGRSPYDVHWNSARMRKEFVKWGDEGVREVPRDTGKTGKGRGKGAKDGVTPGHPWNRETWRRTA